MPLTPTEYRLLARLLSHPAEVVRRRELTLAGWPPGASSSTRTRSTPTSPGCGGSCA